MILMMKLTQNRHLAQELLIHLSLPQSAPLQNMGSFNAEDKGILGVSVINKCV